MDVMRLSIIVRNNLEKEAEAKEYDAASSAGAPTGDVKLNHTDAELDFEEQAADAAGLPLFLVCCTLQYDHACDALRTVCAATKSAYKAVDTFTLQAQCAANRCLPKNAGLLSWLHGTSTPACAWHNCGTSKG